MEITIRERKFSLRSEYEIETPAGTYQAKKQFFTLLAHLELRTADDVLVAKLDGEWSLLRSKFDFEFADGKTYRFWCEKLWKGVYDCESTEEKFILYTHKGLKFSVFQNNVQIAAIRKNRIVIGSGNQYDISISAGVNFLVVICMVLALNTDDSDSDQNTVTIDMGNLGPEERPFDESWQPD